MAALTTKNRVEAIELDADDWLFGGPPDDSYASPWYIFTVKHADATSAQGSLTTDATDRIAGSACSFMGIDVAL